MGVFTASPRTWTAGETVTAANMNAQLRDALNVYATGYTSYTPAIGGGTWSIGNGTPVGGYDQFGKTIDLYAELNFGASGSVFGASSATISLPVSGNGSFIQELWCTFLDSSASTRYKGVALVTGSTATIYSLGTASVMAGLISSAPFTWATGDKIIVSGRYKTA